MSEARFELSECMELMESYTEPFVVLLCPSCGGNNLHQTMVDTYERKKVDFDEGTHTTIRGTVSTVDADMSGNPSPRRQGLVITFRCEHCPAKPMLYVLQHKGCTHLQFVH